MLIFSHSFFSPGANLVNPTCRVKASRKLLCPALNSFFFLRANASRSCFLQVLCSEGTLASECSRSSVMCIVQSDQWQWPLFVLVLGCRHIPSGPAQSSLALPSQQNNKHASQANSSCHVVNGLGYTSWRPAEAFTLRGGITNTLSLSVGWSGAGARYAQLGMIQRAAFFFQRKRFVSMDHGCC